MVTVQLTADAVNSRVGFIASVDGQLITASIDYVSARNGSTPQTFTFNGTWGEGPHQISITEVNAQSQGTANHILQVHGVSYDGEALLSSTASLHGFSTAQLGTAQPGVVPHIIQPSLHGGWQAAYNTAVADTEQVVPSLTGH